MESTITVWSLVGSIVSVVVGFVAVALAVVFFFFSFKMSQSSIEASKSISSTLERIEKLFDTFHSRTFALLGDTVTDMRKHIWPGHTGDDESEVNAEQKAEERIKTLREELTKELEVIVKRIEAKTAAQLDETPGELRSLMDRAITASRSAEIEARVGDYETIRKYVINRLTKRGGTDAAHRLVDSLTTRFPFQAVLDTVHRMKVVGEVDWEGELGPDTRIISRGTLFSGDTSKELL